MLEIKGELINPTMKTIFKLKPILLFILLIGFVTCSPAQNVDDQKAFDKGVEKFLKENGKRWHHLNVPSEDGQLLYNLIVDNNYQSALEIGTSTGHSTTWIAWALSKTGDKLITIELDEGRYREAMENVKAAGLADFVEFRHGDAHKIVPDLEGPFDFVFSDADKDWYVQYFKDINPKLKKGGRFTAHNVLQNISGIREYMEFVNNHPDYETTVDRSSSSGTSISRKK